jgi:class 3 adenylate cyclase
MGYSYTKNGKAILKKPHLDILGYMISITAKMTALAKPGQIIIGQLVYNILEDKQKSAFRLSSISSDIWDYVSNYTGKTYSLYSSL